MRILIGFHGSEASTVVLHDLGAAGLPDETEVLLLTMDGFPHRHKAHFDAGSVAAAGVAIIQKEFPKWVVMGETATGSLPIELLNRAESFKADLIVIGEPQQNISQHNISFRLSSQTILIRAECSVRIARACICPTVPPKRILVGFDGSAGARHAVEVIASREWPADTEVRLLLAADSVVMGSIGRFAPQMTGLVCETKFALQWAKGLTCSDSVKLTKAGISSTVEVRRGNPTDVIVREAKEWNADTIFVGSHCVANSFNGFLIGGVSAAVAAGAHCSVEVVRRGGQQFPACELGLPTVR